MPSLHVLGLRAPPGERGEAVGAVGLGGPDRVEPEPVGLRDRLEHAGGRARRPVAGVVAELQLAGHRRAILSLAVDERRRNRASADRSATGSSRRSQSTPTPSSRSSAASRSRPGAARACGAPRSGSRSPGSRSTWSPRACSTCSAHGATWSASTGSGSRRCSSSRSAALACLWALQRMALHRAAWPDVIESQLAGNALGKIAPAGGAIGAALQYRMLVEAGLERGRTVAGITAVNLLTFAVVLALPVLALPTLLARLGRPQPGRGDPDRRRRVRAAERRGGRAARLRPPARARRRARYSGPQPAPPRPPRRAAALPDPAARASATSCSERSARNGSRRWLPPSAAGRSTTRPCSRRWPRSARPRARARPARLLRRPGSRPDPGHPGRAGVANRRCRAAGRVRIASAS